mgnify:CR=1 FL=1
MPMARRRRSEGFSYLEMMLVMLVIQVCFLMAVPAIARMRSGSEMEDCKYGLVSAQIAAIMSDETIEYDGDEVGDQKVTFNRRGNVNQARTIELIDGDLVVSLGTGRVYEKEEY